VQGFPQGGNKQQISSGSGVAPVWRRDGKQLFYWSVGVEETLGASRVWVVDVQPEGDLAPSKPRPLFELSGYVGGEPLRSWDISRDGQRFLMVKDEERESQPLTEMVFVQNWFGEWRSLVKSSE